MDNIRRKNHFVPRNYLKMWASDDQKIHTYRTLVDHKNVPVWKKFFPSGIAYQEDLYTLADSGIESDNIEHQFAEKFESPAAQALRKVVSDKPLTSQDWTSLIDFLAVQDVRTPVRFKEHLAKAPKIISDILKEIPRSLREGQENLNNSDQLTHKTEVKELATTKSFPLQITKEFDKSSNKSVLRIDTYAGRATWLEFIVNHALVHTKNILHQHKWTIIKPARGYTWFTSDNPVAKINYYGPGKYDLKGGWGIKKGNIIFPVGPEHAMFVQIGDRSKFKGKRLNEETTIIIRKFIAENAHRAIFSHKIDNEVPHLRPRMVDKDLYNKEREEIRNWHSINSKIERQYLEGCS